MTGAQFAAYLGVSAMAVSKAIRAGRLDGAVRWETHGTKQVAVITDLELAVKLWLSRPGARAPALDRAAQGPAPAAGAAPGTGRPVAPPAPAPGDVPAGAGRSAVAQPAAAADPAAPAAPVEGDGALESLTAARLRFERYKALREQLDYEVAAGRLISVDQAMLIFGRQIQDAKTAVMALAKHARSRIPHLTVDDVVTIEELAREALEGLAATAIEKPGEKGAA